MTFSGGGRACIGFKFAEMEMSMLYLPILLLFFAHINTSELVLSVLLETFVFSPSSKDIFWAMSFLQSPVLKGAKSLSPQLPLKLSFVEQQ